MRSRTTVSLAPQVSSYSTSKLLSDVASLPMLSRTIPTDPIFARSLAGVFDYFHWRDIAVLSASDAWGLAFLDDFVAEATGTYNIKCASSASVHNHSPLDATALGFDQGEYVFIFDSGLWIDGGHRYEWVETHCRS